VRRFLSGVLRRVVSLLLEYRTCPRCGRRLIEVSKGRYVVYRCRHCNRAFVKAR